MPKKTMGNLALATYDDIFTSTDTSIKPQSGEQIHILNLDDVYDFENHPFQVRHDAAMNRLVASVKRIGVLEAAIVRPRQEGGYEILAGHRRKMASRLAEQSQMPAVIRDVDDDTATIIMVDSNLEQRETLLPSEKAWAYRMKLEALNHRGERNDLTSSQVGNKLPGKLSVEVVAEQAGESKNQIFRYVRLTELVPDLLDMVDADKIAFNPAVELSYLTRSEQANRRSFFLRKTP